ncbi:hypothetical protein JHK85_000256 [Glycine max]|nr:hypothetical protein JHK85_000256 [Glycine max]
MVAMTGGKEREGDNGTNCQHKEVVKKLVVAVVEGMDLDWVWGKFENAIFACASPSVWPTTPSSMKSNSASTSRALSLSISNPPSSMNSATAPTVNSSIPNNSSPTRKDMVYAKKEGIKAANERGSCSKIGWKMVLWVSGMGVQHGGAQGFNKTYLIWSFSD